MLALSIVRYLFDDTSSTVGLFCTVGLSCNAGLSRHAIVYLASVYGPVNASVYHRGPTISPAFVSSSRVWQPQALVINLLKPAIAFDASDRFRGRIFNP